MVGLVALLETMGYFQWSRVKYLYILAYKSHGACILFEAFKEYEACEVYEICEAYEACE